MAQPNKNSEQKCIMYAGNTPVANVPMSSITWSNTFLGSSGNGGLDVKQTTPTNSLPQVQQIIFSNPMTTVIWADGTKTHSRCSDDDVFDEKIGFNSCVVKKLYGYELYSRLMKRAKR